MSVSFVILMPVILLTIVATFCFAGCTLPVSGLPSPFSNYSKGTVLGTKTVMAYWPLNDKLKDTDNPAPATESQSAIPSSYIDMATAPALYPWMGAPPIQNPPGPDIMSADAPGTIAFGQPGIVKGDAVVPAIPAVIQPCVVVDGCYVEAPFHPKFVPLSSFTVEAWVRVGWTMSDAHAWRFVLDMRDLNPGRGFALLARAEDDPAAGYRWAGTIGNGGAGTVGFTTVPGKDKIELAGGAAPPDPVYLALTYDGQSQTMTFFVNGEPQGSMGTAYMPNTVQPIWIGAGAPFATPRSTPGGIAPLFPFKGAMQDVAIYGEALKPLEIKQHFNNGMGSDPPQG